MSENLPTPTNELIVLFMHHRACAVTKYHFEQVQIHNPELECIPICYAPESSLEGSVDLAAFADPELDCFFSSSGDSGHNRVWMNLDICLLKWFRRFSPAAERVLFLEWDCLVSDSLRHCYADVWDKAVVCSMIKSRHTTPDWAWFDISHPHQLLELDTSAQGAVPLAGMLFSRSSLSAMLSTLLRHRGRYKKLISELRLGAVVADSQLHLSSLPPASSRIIKARELVLRYPREPGIYHPIKQTPHPRFFLRALCNRVQYEVRNDLRRFCLRQLQKILPLCQAIAGVGHFYLGKRKHIVAICSPARSGSTLLKALLGSAEDVSHLPEWPNKQVLSSNRACGAIESFAFYWRVARLSKERIVVIKKPLWVFDAWPYPQLPDRYIPVSVIVLSRDFDSCKQSFFRMGEETEHDYQAVDFSEYYQRCYRSIADYLKRSGNQYRLISYEQMVAEPVALTASLFQWIGSRQEQGTDRYTQYDGPWSWESDDASEKIFSMRVQESSSTTSDSARAVHRCFLEGLNQEEPCSRT